MLTITQVCAKLNIGTNLDLMEILNNDQYLILNKKKYEPHKFSALICKYMETNLTFLIFKTGNIIITGAKDKCQVNDAINDLVLMLNLIGHVDAKIIEWKITNYCAKFEFNNNINIERLIENRMTQCEYEPEIFANLKYKLNGHKFTICRHGCIFATGFKNIRELNKNFKQISKQIDPFIIK